MTVDELLHLILVDGVAGQWARIALRGVDPSILDKAAAIPGDAGDHGAWLGLAKYSDFKGEPPLFVRKLPAAAHALVRLFSEAGSLVPLVGLYCGLDPKRVITARKAALEAIARLDLRIATRLEKDPIGTLMEIAGEDHSRASGPHPSTWQGEDMQRLEELVLRGKGQGVLISPSEASALFGKDPRTLRNWERNHADFPRRANPRGKYDLAKLVLYAVKRGDVDFKLEAVPGPVKRLSDSLRPSPSDERERFESTQPIRRGAGQAAKQLQGWEERKGTESKGRKRK